MTARELRGTLTINNVLEMSDEYPLLVLEEIQSLIDAPELDLPDEAASIANVKLLMHLQSYFGTQYAYLTGLWGVLRLESGKDSKRIAMRDYLDGSRSACSKAYEAASRMLTSFQTVQKEMPGRSW